MNDKSSVSVYFDMGKTGSPFADKGEIRRDLAGVLLVLLQLREQVQAGAVTEAYAKNEFKKLAIYFAMRKVDTPEQVLRGSLLGCFLQLSEALALNGTEQFVLLAGLTAADERITPEHWNRLLGSRGSGKPSLAAVLRLDAFVGKLEPSYGSGAARGEKLALFLAGQEPLTLREMLRLHSEGESWGEKPDGIAGLFCKRVRTAEDAPLAEPVLHRDILEQMEQMAEENRGDWTLRLCGDAGVGKQLLAAHLARHLRRDLLVVDGRRLLDYKKETAVYFGEDGAKNWFYEWHLLAVLSGDLVYLKNVGAADCRLMRDLVQGLLLVGEEETWEQEGDGRKDAGQLTLPHMVTLALQAPTADEKVALWKAFLARFAHDDTVDPCTLGGKYVLNAGEILAVLFAAQRHAQGLAREAIGGDDITWAIGQSQSGGLGSFARPVSCVFDWDDLIVEETVQKQLQYVCAQMKYRHMVGSEWGFYDKMPYGRGLSVLFYGPPGTGKTMAAQVIARETGLDLYRIDLSEMVSKYIGETEKNISSLFAKARHMNVILFFDEADAFFSKRSEVKDSHDRNANAEVAHLLQEIESYEGICILATNRKDDIDDAFKRRIKLMIHFSFPSVETRRLLWHSLLPERAPRRENLALDFFAEKFELSGSQIKDILLMAAFMAADDGAILGNEQIREALCLNYQKYGKLLTDRDFDYRI